MYINPWCLFVSLKASCSFFYKYLFPFFQNLRKEIAGCIFYCLFSFSRIWHLINSQWLWVIPQITSILLRSRSKSHTFFKKNLFLCFIIKVGIEVSTKLYKFELGSYMWSHSNLWVIQWWGLDTNWCSWLFFCAQVFATSGEEVCITNVIHWCSGYSQDNGRVGAGRWGF